MLKAIGDTYEAGGFCTNCRWSGTLYIRKGDPMPLMKKWRSVKCPRCGNYTAHAYSSESAFC